MRTTRGSFPISWTPLRVARQALADTVARNLFKLMAYKDEYEVARLLTKPQFEHQIQDTWQKVGFGFL